MVVSVPEERFEAVPNFEYEPQYATVGELRMACVDVDGEPGSGGDAETFLCLHGEPSRNRTESGDERPGQVGSSRCGNGERSEPFRRFPNG